MLTFLIGSSIASVLVLSFGGTLVTENPSLQFLLRPWVVPEIVDGKYDMKDVIQPTYDEINKEYGLNLW